MVSACGTLLYPERRGQDKGPLDAKVVIMNGIGVLLFVVPGLVAFIVDFATGAIYLPDEGFLGGEIDQWSKGDMVAALDDATVVPFDAAALSPEQLETVIRTASGHDFSLDDPQLSVYRLSAETK